MTSTVPQQFAALAAYLSGVLAKELPAPSFQRPADWEPAMSAEFTYGNSNAGTALLNRGGLEKCELLARRLKELGVQSVVFSIHEHVFRDDRAADFLAFYTAAIAAARGAGLGIIAETAAPFLAPPLTEYEAHVESRQRAVKTVAGELLQAGDTLIVADEDSEAVLTGFPELKTPAGNAAFVTRLLEVVPYSRGILIGAGAGAWQTLPWHDALLKLGLDVYSCHAWGVTGGALTRLCAVAARAAAQGIRVVVGEAGCMKALPRETVAPNTRARVNSILARDVYSHWDEIDGQFLEVMAATARTYGFAAVSWFNTLRLFEGLQAKDGMPGVGYDLGQRLLSLAADRALRAGDVSPLGAKYQELTQAAG